MKDEEKSEIKSLIGEFISSKSPSKAKAKKKEPDSAGRSGQPVQTSQGEFVVVVVVVVVVVAGEEARH